MMDLFVSIATKGLRESFRIWWRRENTLLKKPSKTHPRYARIRRRTKNGRKTRPAVYRLTTTSEGELGETNTYERVKDGTPLDDDDVVEWVTVKKGVLQNKRQRQRTTYKEKGRKKILGWEQWAAV